MSTKHIGGAVLVCMGLALLGTGALPSVAASTEGASVVGREQPQSGCAYDNGFNVCNFGDANLRDQYLELKEYLGAPVSGFDATCQTFRLGRLCYHPGNIDGWKVELANLGLQDLQARGMTATPGVEPPAALRDWLIAQMEGGTDLTRVVGRTVSRPVCDGGTRLCWVWTDKQRFEYPNDARNGDAVVRAPLGLWAVRHEPDTRATSVNPLLTGTGVAFTLVGAVMLLIGTTRRRSSAIPA